MTLAPAIYFDNVGTIHVMAISALSNIWPPLVGGVLIGLSAGLMWFFFGRIAGVSGILDGIFRIRDAQDKLWRLAFVFGLLSAGIAGAVVHPATFGIPLSLTSVKVVVAGLLVGFGTRLGGGCTSGHGVCGIGRLSPRSFCATVTFVIAGMITVLLCRILLGML